MLEPGGANDDKGKMQKGRQVKGDFELKHSSLMLLGKSRLYILEDGSKYLF